MKVLVTGSTGMVGSALTPYLQSQGITVIPLVRDASKGSGIHWDPAAGTIDKSKLDGFDAVVHLAGESIQGKWNKTKKAKIRDSRVKGTQLLCEALAAQKTPPRVFISASASGYYGDRGSEILREDSGPGSGFLPDVCVGWENASEPLAAKAVRTVHLRFGIVLGANGGALKEMLPPFKKGAGARVGSGKQYYSWVALDDVARMIHHALQTDSLQGPVNAVTPNPVTNEEFTKALAGVLQRPAIAIIPAFVVRIVFGEMGNALLLASARMDASKVIASGFVLHYPEIAGALYHELS